MYSIFLFLNDLSILNSKLNPAENKFWLGYSIYSTVNSFNFFCGNYETLQNWIRSVDPHIFANPDPGSINLTDPVKSPASSTGKKPLPAASRFKINLLSKKGLCNVYRRNRSYSSQLYGFHYMNCTLRTYRLLAAGKYPHCWSDLNQ